MNKPIHNHIRKSGRFLAAVLVLALVTLACGLINNRPGTQIETGPDQKVDIQIPMPEGLATNVELNLEFVAGVLKLSPAADPGSGGYLASGTATFNAAVFEPKVEVIGSSYTLHSGSLEIEAIPIFKDETKNEWDLQIANTPMSLNINAGAYKGIVELGGLSLEKLSISDGGSEFTGSFSEPNQVEMASFTYSTGASSAELKGLANANFAEMTFTSGAGDYTLSFDGDLQRDARVTIDAGLATVNIIVPEGINAVVASMGSLTGISPSGEWSQSGSVYTLSGSGPALTITVKMGAGALNLRNE